MGFGPGIHVIAQGRGINQNKKKGGGGGGGGSSFVRGDWRSGLMKRKEREDWAQAKDRIDEAKKR